MIFNRMRFLTEKTRAAKEGVIFDPLERAKRWVGKGCFFHLSDLNKLGINPLTGYGTPVGIYAYPLDAKFYNDLVRNLLPFAGDRQFVHIFRPASEIVILTSELSKDDYDVYVGLLRKKYGDDSFDELVEKAEEGAEVQSPAGMLWNVTRLIADGNISKWRKVFVSVGVDGFADDGNEIIHENEPTQAVFFGKYAIEQLDTIEWPTKIHDRESKTTLRDVIDGKLDPNDVSVEELSNLFRFAHYGMFGIAHGSKKVTERLRSVLLGRLTPRNLADLFSVSYLRKSFLMFLVSTKEFDDARKIELMHSFLEGADAGDSETMLDWACRHHANDLAVKIILDKGMPEDPLPELIEWFISIMNDSAMSRNIKGRLADAAAKAIDFNPQGKAFAKQYFREVHDEDARDVFFAYWAKQHPSQQVMGFYNSLIGK
jgi:hypothetical protein